MSAQSFLAVMRDLARSMKLTFGIWGCVLAPIMIWAGLILVILSTLGIDVGLANQTLLGLQLFLVGLFWELVIYFTFVDTQN